MGGLRHKLERATRNELKERMKQKEGTEQKERGNKENRKREQRKGFLSVAGQEKLLNCTSWSTSHGVPFFFCLLPSFTCAHFGKTFTHNKQCFSLVNSFILSLQCLDQYSCVQVAIYLSLLNCGPQHCCWKVI